MAIREGAVIDATRLWARSEATIDGWPDLQRRIDELSNAYPREAFVWRGHQNASWGLHSSLSRSLLRFLGQAPTESELVRAEKELLWRARTDWRLDGIPALPLLAQMQHVGAPTRLLDVTLNPLIAAWFAVQQDDDLDLEDGRLIVFVDNTNPVQLNSLWKTNTPRWHQLKSDSERRQQNWGTGLGRRVWRPPALHARIPAQNAAFILDGAPVFTQSPWIDMTASQMRQFSSIPLRLAPADGGRVPQENAPVFTYRIAAHAKKEIRRQIEDRFGYTIASIYPDLEGFASWARGWRPGA